MGLSDQRRRPLAHLTPAHSNTVTDVSIFSILLASNNGHGSYTPTGSTYYECAVL